MSPNSEASIMRGVGAALDLPEAEIATAANPPGVITAVTREISSHAGERPKFLTSTPRPGETKEELAIRMRVADPIVEPIAERKRRVDAQSEMHAELLDALADLPIRFEIATDDAARRLGCMPQRERVKKALLALLSSAAEARVRELEAELTEAVRLLEPFATNPGLLHFEYLALPDTAPVEIQVIVGHLRAARAFLVKHKGEA